jgi:hypothetical protein
MTGLVPVIHAVPQRIRQKRGANGTAWMAVSSMAMTMHTA